MPSLFSSAPTSALTEERLFSEAKGIFPGGETRNSVFFRPHPLYIKSARGSHMVDVDGNDYVDFTNCMTALMLGHSHPAVVAAVTEQVANGTAYAAANPWAQELGALIKQRQPSIERLRFTNTGAARATSRNSASGPCCRIVFAENRFPFCRTMLL